MKVYCSTCNNEQFVDEPSESTTFPTFRCPNCGQVGTLKCAHVSCFEGYCEDCGEPEPSDALDPMDIETDL